MRTKIYGTSLCTTKHTLHSSLYIRMYALKISCVPTARTRRWQQYLERDEKRPVKTITSFFFTGSFGWTLHVFGSRLRIPLILRYCTITIKNKTIIRSRSHQYILGHWPSRHQQDLGSHACMHGARPLTDVNCTRSSSSSSWLFSVTQVSYRRVCIITWDKNHVLSLPVASQPPLVRTRYDKIIVHSTGYPRPQ